VSNLSMQCCCELPISDCDDSCDCATSYVVDSISFPYRYERTVDIGSGFNCQCSPSAGCGHIVHQFQLAVGLVAPFTINRTQIGSNPAECCYRGYGDVQVLGTLKVQWQTYCQGDLECPVTEEELEWSFDRVTCVCVQVVCSPGPPGTAARWLISIEVGDFIITCSHQFFDIKEDCDPECPELLDPRRIVCEGGNVKYTAPLRCLDTLMPGEFTCAGYGGTVVCGDPTAPPPVGARCFEYTGSGTQLGPFGLRLRDECSPGQDDEDCIDEATTSSGPHYTWLEHQLPPSQTQQPINGAWTELLTRCSGNIRVETSQSSCDTLSPIQFS